MTSSSLPIVLYAVPFLAALLVAVVGWYVRGSARVIAVSAMAMTATPIGVAPPWQALWGQLVTTRKAAIGVRERTDRCERHGQ